MPETRSESPHPKSGTQCFTEKRCRKLSQLLADGRFAQRDEMRVYTRYIPFQQVAHHFQLDLDPFQLRRVLLRRKQRIDEKDEHLKRVVLVLHYSH